MKAVLWNLSGTRWKNLLLAGASLLVTAAAAAAVTGCAPSTDDGLPGDQHHEIAIVDEYVQRTDALMEDRTPTEPDPSSYGMDQETGRFVYPSATPHQEEPKPVTGQLDYWDTNEYTHNMKVEA